MAKTSTRNLTAFFIIAYSISWVIWLPLVLEAFGTITGPVTPYLHLLGGLGPLIAALIITYFLEGKENFRDLVASTVRWRTHWIWYIVSIVAMFVFFFISIIIMYAINGTFPDISQLGQSERYSTLLPPLYWIANIIFFGFGEEVGWRGYVQPRLQAKYNALISTVIVSIPWALWHIPLFSFIEGYTQMNIGSMVGWYLSILTGSILLTWILNSTGGSVFHVAIFHGVLDIVINSPVGGDLQIIMGFLVTLWGIVVLIVYRPRNLAKRERFIVVPKPEQ